MGGWSASAANTIDTIVGRSASTAGRMVKGMGIVRSGELRELMQRNGRRGGIRLQPSMRLKTDMRLRDYLKADGRCITC